MKKLFIFCFTLLFVTAFSQNEAENIKEITVTSNDSVNKNTENIPFAVIEQIPIFPECEKTERSEQLSCFNTINI